MVNIDLIAAHQHSIRHREELLASERCGCFNCLRIYAPAEIRKWTDMASNSATTADEDAGVTALCPCCGIESVIGDRSGFPVTPEFLAAMHRQWFAKLGAPPSGFFAAYGGTLLYCALVLLFCAQAGGGMMLFLVGLPWLIYAGYSLMAMDRAPLQRRWRTAKLLMWLAAFGLCLGLQKKYEIDAAADARQSIAQVLAFKQAHGRFPDEKEIRLTHKDIWPLDAARYFVASGGSRHAIVYYDTWVIFHSHWYDFERGEWRAYVG